MEIRALYPNDWPAVKRIYEAGIATQIATFETEVPPWEIWDKNHLSYCRLVSFREDIITGWVALSPVSSRCVYQGVAEVSVYIDPDFHGLGIGKTLMEQVIESSETAGIWTLQSGIFSSNEASIKLHEKVGFRIVGTREKLGMINGKWQDIILMERRSPKVG